MLMSMIFSERFEATGLEEAIVNGYRRLMACARAGVLGGLLAVMGPPTVFAQVEITGTGTSDYPGTFAFDAIAFASGSPNQSRLDVFSMVGYDALSFIKQDDLYYASYEQTISIFDSAGSLASEKLWTEELKGISFDLSVSTLAYSLTQRVFSLAPGKYSIVNTVRDNESKITRRIARQILVSDFSHPAFSLSDIMLLNRITVQGDKRSILPNITSNVGDLPEAFHLYLEVYNQAKIDSVLLSVTVLSEKGEQKLQSDTATDLHAGKNEKILRIDHTSLSLGDYRLYIRAYPLHQKPAIETDYLGVTNRAFLIRWRGLPKNLKDLDVAIDQLRYITKDDEWSRLKEAKTPEEKQARFLEFWKKRDPNPNTPRNEKLEEFYQRVEYANKHFSHYTEGWRTDMGMIYLIFGPPNNVDRHPFDIDAKPYEIWFYYDLNYSFMFLDQTGFGDYRLLTQDWQYLNRYRN